MAPRAFLHCLLGLLLLALAPPSWAAPDGFDLAVDGTKREMLARPGVALTRARAAHALASVRPAGRDRELAVATAQWLEAEALTRLNRLREARPVVQRALATVIRQDPARTAKLHGDLLRARGNLSGLSGDVQAALADFQAAYDIYLRAGEPRGQAMALQNIGALYTDAGDYPRVLRYYRQSAEAFAGDPALLVAAYNNRGRALRSLGRLAAADAEYRRGVAAARRIGSAGLEEAILENRALALIDAGRLDEAERSLDRAFELTRMQGGPPSTPGLWGIAAQAALKRGDLQEAEISVRRAFAVPGAASDISLREFHRTASTIYKGLGKDREALSHLEAYKVQDDRARSIAASAASQLMAARFDFANQDLKIARLNADRVKREAASAAAAARFQNTIYSGLLIASGIVVALLLFGVVSIRRSRDAVSAANAGLSDANRKLEKALRAKTEFLATTSHEIRTPLNGILGMTQVILADRAVEPALVEKVKLVHGAGETMKALIDDILDVAKMETGNLVLDRRPMDLHALLNDACRLWSAEAGRKGVRVVARFDEAPRLIVEDETRLRQVIFNLMSNAVKFTREGQVELAVRAEGDELVAAVSDSGIGIPREKFGEIFESFRQVDGGTTRQFGGTGLGLAICRNIAEALDGSIGVESEVGRGSTFTIRLPLTPAGEEEEQAAGDALLLVEMNPLAQSMLKAVLARGHDAIVTAAGVPAAVAALRGPAVARVLVDAATAAAEGDRDAAVAAIAAVAGERPVVVTVANLQPGDEAALIAAGATTVLAKPIGAPALLAALAPSAAEKVAAA